MMAVRELDRKKPHGSLVIEKVGWQQPPRDVALPCGGVGDIPRGRRGRVKRRRRECGNGNAESLRARGHLKLSRREERCRFRKCRKRRGKCGRRSQQYGLRCDFLSVQNTCARYRDAKQDYGEKTSRTAVDDWHELPFRVRTKCRQYELMMRSGRLKSRARNEQVSGEHRVPQVQTRRSSDRFPLSGH